MADPTTGAWRVFPHGPRSPKLRVRGVTRS
jgi:hypothetical protein